ncbi:hypothetical protein CsSME_00046112 [Camellia sinensis var. sinensis]|uniref:protein sym-1-like n=1 Tax=Camellia sinensis TaxID=4442 RepID=UPI001035ABF7|nr:protein sym-1-like [Camellia sinensis]
MVLNPATISRRTPLLFKFAGFPFKPISRFANQAKIPLNPFQIGGFKSCSSCNSRPLSLNYTRPSVFKDLGFEKTGYRLLGIDHFRVSAVSDGGSGGSGGRGGYGSSGGGNSGDGGSSGGGRSDWSLLSWYLTLLEKHPVLTKAVTSAFLTFIGDLICQVMIDQVPSLDLKRTFLFTLLGLVLVGPTLHFWYLSLSKLVTLPGASGAFLRLLLDQFLFSPLFIGLFLSTLVTLEGRPSQVVPKLQQEWFSAVLANWQLWIPFQFLNFRFVPQQFQVLAANVIALVWNVILSYKAHKEVLPK